MRIEVERYEQTSAGIVVEHIQLADVTQNTPGSVTVEYYDAANAGIVMKRIPVADLAHRCR